MSLRVLINPSSPEQFCLEENTRVKERINTETKSYKVKQGRSEIRTVLLHAHVAEKHCPANRSILGTYRGLLV